MSQVTIAEQLNSHDDASVNSEALP